MRHAGQSWTFFELDPAVARLAGPTGYFSYLRQCAVSAKVVVGDARWSLERASLARYDVLIIDAFSSDAIPVHLLTREALRVYLSRLAPDGLIAFHISNRFMALGRPVADLARDAGLECMWKSEPRLSESERTARVCGLGLDRHRAPPGDARRRCLPPRDGDGCPDRPSGSGPMTT